MRLPFLLLLLSTSPVLASSDDAWAQFQTDVETACTALAPEAGETAIEVNPFGSETYGAAIMVTTYEGGGVDRFLCIYDKHSKKAELTAAFTPVKDDAAAKTQSHPVSTQTGSN